MSKTTHTVSVKLFSSPFVTASPAIDTRLFIKSLIIDCIQRKTISPLYDERLLLPEENWRKELCVDDIQYLKGYLFSALLGKSIDEYAKGLMTTDEKIELAHSILKSMYREQINFINQFEQ